MRRRLTLAFLCGGAIAGMLAFACLHWMLAGSTSVRFENRSEVALQGATISGAGFEASLGNVGPGETAHVRVYPAGESAIRVGFRANGQVVSTPHDVYFEGGGDDDVEVAVDANLETRVKVESFPFALCCCREDRHPLPGANCIPLNARPFRPSTGSCPCQIATRC